ncbi:hypothetical protein KSW81_007993 [Nannochloris sp. 'desiccata']|nr:hypothetical protein KSW81_007993 [Chlorella desiccata (nom. nud.)]
MAGASGGIGEACAWRFAEAGCRLILIARRADRLASLKQELEDEYSASVHTIDMDVTDIPTVMKLPTKLPSEFSSVDILVNNAGLALGVDAADDVSSLADARTMFECNVMAVIAFTKAFGSLMRERNFGHIIMMSSIAGKEFYAGGSVYCATKHALEAYTGGARHDFVGTNVRVTTISPGAVKTEFSVVRFKGDQEKADAVYDRIHPLTAADIADNVLYAATRPPHVQVADILVFATYQCSAKGLARVLLEGGGN